MAPSEPPMKTGRASSALGWSFLNTISARLGTIAIGIALARLLGPEAFGTYAVAFVALLAVLSFNELGVSLAIVRWPHDPREIAPTVTTISVGMSLVITAGMYVVAPYFASAMGDPSATNLVRLLSLCVLLNGAIATPAALLQRYLRQDKRMIADQVNVWVGALVSVAFAIAGSGALGLVVGRLAGAGTSAIVFLVFSPLPYRFGWDRRFTRALFHFGLPLAGASVIVFALGFVDQITVGHLLGPVALGYYVLAVNLANWPVSLLSQPLRSVVPAVLSRLQHDKDQMQRAFFQTLRPLAALALPACAALAAASDDIVTFLYGDRWHPAASVLAWLGVLAAFRIFFELTYDYLVVLGRSRMILLIQVLSFACLLPLIIFAVNRYGIAGAAGAQIVVAAVVVLPLYLVEFRKSGLRGIPMLNQIWASVAAAVGVWWAVTLIDDLVASTFGALAVSGVVTLLAIVGLVYCFRSDLKALRGARLDGA